MQFLRKYWYVTSFVVGALSGGVSYGVIILGGEINYSFYHTIIPYLPGLLFGLISSLYFLLFLKSRVSTLKNLGWVFFSTLSFCFSYYIFMSSKIFLSGGGYVDISVTGMGFVGGLVVLLAFNFLIIRLTLIESIFLILLTTLIPMFLGAEYLSKDGFFAIFTFFPWQAAVMVVFAHAINRSNQNFVEDEVNRIQGVQEQINTPSQTV